MTLTKCTLTFLLLGCATLAPAQTKISGLGKCAKPDSQQAVDAGDRPGHMLLLMKQTCSWATPFEMAGAKTKTYTVALTSDSSATRSQDRGYVVITMDSGDKAYVQFQGSGVMKNGMQESSSGTWTFTGGTGKLTGLKGKGTYKGTGSPDGGGQDQVDGEYTLAK